MAGMAGYPAVPNWLETSAVLLILGILYVFSCEELCLVMLVGLVPGEF